jgi:hypothetical protein
MGWLKKNPAPNIELVYGLKLAKFVFVTFIGFVTSAKPSYMAWQLLMSNVQETYDIISSYKCL